MSGAFGLISPKDLLGKLERDLDALRRSPDDCDLPSISSLRLNTCSIGSTQALRTERCVKTLETAAFSCSLCRTSRVVRSISII